MDAVSLLERTPAAAWYAVHATFVPASSHPPEPAGLFVWRNDDEPPIPGPVRTRTLAVSGVRRSPRTGVQLDIDAAIQFLVSVGSQQPEGLSDSVRCWSAAVLLALELASRHRAIPTIIDDHSRWIGLLSDPGDRERFAAIARALPPAARSCPKSDRGHIELESSVQSVRAFVDAVIDHTYRQKAHAGPARGWVYDLAEGLRGHPTPFESRDPRHQGTAARLAAWASDADLGDVVVQFRLQLPESGGRQFPLQVLIAGSSTELVSADRAFASTDTEGSLPSRSPRAWQIVRGLARAARLYTPLLRSLDGSRPQHVLLELPEVRELVSDGARLLRAAGFAVELPVEFADHGGARVSVRVAIDGPSEGELPIAVPYRYEAVLGDVALDNKALEALLQSPDAVQQVNGRWVLLDRAELGRLPPRPERDGEMATAVALHALLGGTWNGVPAVATPRFAARLELLRQPTPMRPPSTFVGELRAYQERGAAWLAELARFGLGGCLADDMGLGKTVQLIAHIAGRPRGRPSLVVCPTSVLGTWQRELGRFAPSLRVLRHHGAARDEKLDADVVITTYGLLVRDSELLTAMDWDVVALDEAQAIKNPDSRRAQVARSVHARQRVALSGTPVENRLDELWSLMQFLVPGFLAPRARFQRETAIPIERFGDTVAAGRLRNAVAPFVMRRTKRDPGIAPELPEKSEFRRYAPVTAEQARLYSQVVEDHMEKIADSGPSDRRGRVLAMLTHLKQVCNHPAHYLGERDQGVLSGRSGKLDRCTELLSAIVDAGEAAVVFTQYREMGELLVRHLTAELATDVPFLHGGVPVAAREAMIADFQDRDGPPVFIVSLRAGGTGIELTRATHVIHFDRWWNPAIEDQATDRAHRIGQDRTVSVHKLICHDTLEERIDAMLDGKRTLAGLVVASGEASVLDLDDAALSALVALGADAVVEA